MSFRELTMIDVKEATRLGPARLPHGHYISLLRLTMAHLTKSPLAKMCA